MPLLFDSLWRAVLYCVHPRVVLLSLLPLFLMVGLTLGLGYLFWDLAVDQLRAALDALPHSSALWQWLDGVGQTRVTAILAPLLLVLGLTPLIAVLSMVLVALWMAPSVVTLVASQRFAGMAEQGGAGLMASLGWTLMSTLLALLALLLSMPLWLIPPLVLVLPPLIWGWLTYRVMAFDALARHASAAERRILLHQHRGRLLLIGVLVGLLGGAPGALWALSSGFAPAFVLLAPLAVWVYMLLFAFASLWFTHYCLAALHALRLQAPPLSSKDTA